MRTGWVLGSLRTSSLLPSEGGGCWAGNKDMLTRSEGRWATDQGVWETQPGLQTSWPEWSYY